MQVNNVKFIVLFVIDIVVLLLSLHIYWISFLHFPGNIILTILAIAFAFFAVKDLALDIKEYDNYKNNKPSK